MSAARFHVGGVVQGVAFRAYTRSRAIELDLDGCVRNLPDGRVEVIAAGTPVALDTLEAWLWEGSPASHVREVLREPWTHSVPMGFVVK